VSRCLPQRRERVNGGCASFHQAAHALSRDASKRRALIKLLFFVARYAEEEEES